jgi:hypothetical protein
MATCPLCLFPNAADAAMCARCGKFRFPDDAGEPSVVSELNTRIVSQMHDVAVVDEGSSRTVRGPLTVPGSAMRTAVGSVAAAMGAENSDTYSMVSVETTPEPLAPATPRLVVIRGEKVNAEFPIYGGKNFIGRSADKPVDIDLTAQESPEQVWSSRQHAVVTFDRGLVLIEDLNSLNGTFVNRSRLHPGQQRVLQSSDIVQVGTVQFKVMI